MNKHYPTGYQSLIKHGKKVFGSKPKFEEWLQSRNFFFDGKPPIEFLSTVSGLNS